MNGKILKMSSLKMLTIGVTIHLFMVKLVIIVMSTVFAGLAIKTKMNMWLFVVMVIMY